MEATRDEVERRREVVSLAQLESALTGRPGPRRELAVLNAGAAIYAGGGVDSLADGVRAAQAAIDDGAAAAALERFVARTSELAPE